MDPIATLEKLINLLRLSHEAYAGKEMVCSAGGFSFFIFLMKRVGFPPKNLVKRRRDYKGVSCEV